MTGLILETVDDMKGKRRNVSRRDIEEAVENVVESDGDVKLVVKEEVNRLVS